jgi:hypothetical protein
MTAMTTDQLSGAALADADAVRPTPGGTAPLGFSYSVGSTPRCSCRSRFGPLGRRSVVAQKGSRRRWPRTSAPRRTPCLRTSGRPVEFSTSRARTRPTAQRRGPLLPLQGRALHPHLRGGGREHALATVANGENADERSAPTPGAQAATNHAVRRPLRESGLTKNRVRAIALAWRCRARQAAAPASPRGSRTARRSPPEVARSRPASVPCAPSFTDSRVRHHGDVARIEVPAARSALRREEVPDHSVRAPAERRVRHCAVDLSLHQVRCLQPRGARPPCLIPTPTPCWHDTTAPPAAVPRGRVSEARQRTARPLAARGREHGAALEGGARRRRPDTSAHPVHPGESRWRGGDLLELPMRSRPEARLVAWPPAPPSPTGARGVACAAPRPPVAREAELTASIGTGTELLVDVGVAASTHPRRLTCCGSGGRSSSSPAGRALQSEEAGLVRVPVVAVADDDRQRAAFGGIAPLLAMLNACARRGRGPTSTGYGGAHLAARSRPPRPGADGQQPPAGEQQMRNTQ